MLFRPSERPGLFLHEGADGSLDGRTVLYFSGSSQESQGFQYSDPCPLKAVSADSSRNTWKYSRTLRCPWLGGALPVSGPLGLGCCGFLKQKQLLTSSPRRFVCFTLRVSVWRFQ